MIESIFNIFHKIPVEYHVASLGFLIVVFSIKFPESRFVRMLSLPVAIIIWISIEIYQYLRHLQLAFLIKQIKQGGRYRVMLIFTIVVVLGVVLYLVSYVFLALMTIHPAYYIPSFVLSTIGKYLNLIVVPEIIRYGSDKLNTFAWFRWCYKMVSAFWAKFKTLPYFDKLAALTARVKQWAYQFPKKVNNTIKRYFPEKDGKQSAFQIWFEHVKSWIEGLKKKRKKRDRTEQLHKDSLRPLQTR